MSTFPRDLGFRDFQARARARYERERAHRGGNNPPIDYDTSAQIDWYRLARTLLAHRRRRPFSRNNSARGRREAETKTRRWNF